LGRSCRTHWTDGSACKIFIRKRERKRPRGRLGWRWVDNIGMDLKEIGWEVVNWVHMAQDRDRWRDLVNMVMNLGVS
jgi:hypothetical protein